MLVEIEIPENWKPDKRAGSRLDSYIAIVEVKRMSPAKEKKWRLEPGNWFEMCGCPSATSLCSSTQDWMESEEFRGPSSPGGPKHVTVRDAKVHGVNDSGDIRVTKPKYARVVEDKMAKRFLLLLMITSLEYSLLIHGRGASAGTTAEKLYPWP